MIHLIYLIVCIITGLTLGSMCDDKFITDIRVWIIMGCILVARFTGLYA